MPRIVLYQPPTEARSAYSDRFGNEQIWLPHGLLCIAAVLDEDFWDVSLIDGRIYPEGGLPEIAKRIDCGDFLAASVMTGHTIHWALKASEVAKHSGARTVWGGPHPTLFPRQTLEHPFVDFIILGGRGEGAFASWASGIENDNSDIFSSDVGFKITGVPMLLQRSDSHSKGIHRDKIPPPRLDLIENYSPYLVDDPALTEKTTNHVTSTGCPYDCTFCCEPALSGGHWYGWSAGRAIREIERLLAVSRATSVKLHDALFFVSMERARIISAGMRQLNVKWAATMHPKTLQKITCEELERFSTEGLTRLMIGLESGNQLVINSIKKRFNVKSIPDMACKLRNTGIIGMFTLMVGFPNAPQDEYQETIEAAHAIRQVWGKHQIKIHYASPWPGTMMWDTVSSLPSFSPPATLLEWANYDYYVPQAPHHNRSWQSEIERINRDYCPYYHA